MLQKLRALLFSTIKRRFIFMLTLSSIVSITGFFVISYRNTTYIINGKIYESFHVYLNSIGDTLDKTITEMNKVSSNLVYQGNPISEQFDLYMEATNPVLKNQYKHNIESQLVEYDYTSNSIGLVAFYNTRTNKAVISSEVLKNTPVLDSTEKFFKVNASEIRKPHKTLSYRSVFDVLSLTRSANPENEDNGIIVYMETDQNFLENLLRPQDSFSKTYDNMILGITDSEDNVIYTTNKSLLPIGADYKTAEDLLKPFFTNGYHCIVYTAENWKLVGFVKSTSYISVYMPLLKQFIFSLIVFIALYMVLAYFLWRMVYNPINNFTIELQNMDRQQLYKPRFSKTKELDQYLGKFEQMRYQILRLVSQVEAEARNNANLEIELLLGRINPHFLNNTLASIKWLAIKNNQTEISELLLSLNNLLHYNLGKSKITTLSEELKAVEDYLTLQRRIYSFTYIKNAEVSAGILDMKFPCFILQPAVENSLMHGFTENLTIRLDIENTGNLLKISISDNGKGMDEGKLTKLNAQLKDKSFAGMGIGLNYVNRALKMMFGSYVQTNIESEENKGTKFSICIRIDNRLEDGEFNA